MGNRTAGERSDVEAEDPPSSWSKQVNLKDALAGKAPPGPRVCSWTDSVDGKSVTRSLFYPNELHSVGGEPESMKTWLLLYACAQEIKLGDHVFFFDMEANDRSIVERMRLLGADKGSLKERFHYFRPDAQIGDADQSRFKRFVKKYRPTLVVLDGVTEAFAVHGLSINSAEDAAHWFRNFGRQFQVKATADYPGPAIVELDHVVKDKDSRGGWNIGSQHKKAGLKGAMYAVEVQAPLGKGKHGKSRLFLSKDSPGGVEWTAYGKDRRRLVATLHCDATGEAESIAAYIESPIEGAEDGLEREPEPLVSTLKFRNLMQQISKSIKNNPECSMDRVKSLTTGTDSHKRVAVEELMAGGYVKDVGNRQHRYVHVKDFDPMRPAGAADGEAT